MLGLFGNNEGLIKALFRHIFKSMVGKTQEYKLDDDLEVKLKIDFVDIKKTENGTYETYRIEGVLVRRVDGL